MQQSINHHSGKRGRPTCASPDDGSGLSSLCCSPPSFCNKLTRFRLRLSNRSFRKSARPFCSSPAPAGSCRIADHSASKQARKEERKETHNHTHIYMYIYVRK